MDTLLALILSCSLHPDDALVRAFIQRVSDGNIYFVGDLATVTSHDHVKGIGDALALVEEIEKHGGRPAVGLMAVPVEWAARYGRTVADLFDGCINIAIGTDAMAAFASACDGARRRPAGDRPKRRGRSPSLLGRRDCILRRFDLDLGVRGYPRGVLAELQRMSAERLNAIAASPKPGSRVADDETVAPTAHDPIDWSDARLYFTPPVTSAAPVSGAAEAGATLQVPRRESAH
jgi:hypothetical protein